MSKLIKWLAPSLQGPDGKSSARALTNFWYVLLNTGISISIVVLAYRISDQRKPTQEAIAALKILVWLCVIYNLTILVIFGIVTAQQVNEGIRALRGRSQEPETIKQGDEITVKGKIE
ncbi:hypothetical protein [Desertivirga xinjiangensis]|uniref:hypothetical protein n=1 Tax=Desertivirga xinjiangensis TaxID=539206 RepID=UPI0021093B86|nr:hypothetical protein [Pedobacter xinjiangensis]